MRTVKNFTDFTQQLLSESEVLNEDCSNLLLLDQKLYEMKEKKYTQEQINEGLLDILSWFGNGFVDRLKNYAAGWILEKIGIPQTDKDGNPYFITEWVKNIVESINFSHIGSYFGEGACKSWMKAISNGLIETTEERAIQILLRNLGFNIDFSGGIGGTLVGTVRETLTNAANSTKFMQEIEKGVSGWLCNLSFSDLVKGKLSTNDKHTVLANARKNEPDNSNLFNALGKLFK